MTTHKKHTHSWLQFPPLLIIGAVVILIPIFYFMTVHSLTRQRENVTNLLVEKGAALIRSFEAGARTGMMGSSTFQVQRLLNETSKQPDIAYLLVIDTNGVVLAHNDPEKIGTLYGNDLNKEHIASSRNMDWREVVSGNGIKIFEVYSVFEPVQGMRHHQFGRHVMGKSRPTSAPQSKDSAQIIFVGLNMESIERAHQQDARHTIIMAAILLLISFAGLITVFLLQAFRTSQSSLARLTLFSEHLTENMPIGLLALDSAGKIAALNRTGEDLLGVQEKDIIGQRVEDNVPVAFKQLSQKLKNHSGVFESEMECSLSDGKRIPLEVIGTSLYGEDHSPSGQIILFKDLREIKELKREIVRSQRLAAIGRLAAGVAHEIRNPLSSIKGFATYFRERYQDVAEDQQVAEIMIGEVERLNRVISQLLEFARPLKIEKKEVSLPELLEHSLRMIEDDAIQKNITIKKDIHTIPQSVWLDGDRLKQVLLNLYLNALESMDEGGSLIVSAYVDDKTLTLKISDTGKGIPDNEIGSIFDPYYTTKSSGTGLGLAIVHKIIEACEGQISVQSKLGSGTEFLLHIPCAKGDDS
jgi:two-component system sensor histidine kinase HydH